MVRAKQAKPPAAQKPPGNSPKSRPPPSESPALWKKLRLRRKKASNLLPATSIRELLKRFSVPRVGFGVQGAAVAALREGCEAHLVDLLEEWGLCALHAGRAAVQTADVSLVRCIRMKRG
ncbi:histone H3-like [Heliangelus exortis]|uniref:histone H3-like n=1 Tax=Heliangelus exortis TaxID=472823 RepID=UPI003A8DAC38